MIRDLHPGSEPAAAVIRREVLATAATAVLFPLGWTRRPRPTRRAALQRTVVLVHGCFANSSSLLPVEAYLRAHGVRQILSYSYNARHGLEAAALGLRDFLRAHVRGGRVDLVCHSYGGLVARAYLQYLRGARRVDHCITLGTPHQGTYNAYWLASRVGQELPRPDSAALARLAATRHQAAPVRFLAIVAGSDNIVIPRIFGTHGEDVLHLPGIGHLGLLFSPRALRAVANRLLNEPHPQTKSSGDHETSPPRQASAP